MWVFASDLTTELSAELSAENKISPCIYYFLGGNEDPLFYAKQAYTANVKAQTSELKT